MYIKFCIGFSKKECNQELDINIIEIKIVLFNISKSAKCYWEKIKDKLPKGDQFHKVTNEINDC